MHPNNKEKTVFYGIDTVYCYKMMPFNPKNTSTTYQHSINKLFTVHIGMTIEAYIDDMIAKSTSKYKHVNDLWEAFQIMREN